MIYHFDKLEDIYHMEGHQNGTEVSGRLNQVIFEVDRNLIEPDPDQPRKEFDKGKMAELATSIAATGQNTPALIRVNPDTPGRYIIVDGERRWRATGMAGVSFLKAWIFTGTPLERMIQQAVSNFGREGHTAVETANIIANLKAASLEAGEALSDEDVGKYFGKSPSWVNQHLILLKLPEGVLKYMKEPIPLKRRLPFSTALLLVPFKEDVQISLATEFFENKVGYNTAKMKILKLNNKLKDIGEKGIKPRAEIRKLETFVNNGIAAAEVILGMHDDVYIIGIQNQPVGFDKTIVKKLNELQMQIQKVKEKITKATQPYER